MGCGRRPSLHGSSRKAFICLTQAPPGLCIGSLCFLELSEPHHQKRYKNEASRVCGSCQQEQ